MRVCIRMPPFNTPSREGLLLRSRKKGWVTRQAKKEKKKKRRERDGTYSTTGISSLPEEEGFAGQCVYSPLGTKSAPAPCSPHVHNVNLGEEEEGLVLLLLLPLLLPCLCLATAKVLLR